MTRKKPSAPALEGGDALLVSLPGVGPETARKLAARGLERVADLWFWLPRTHEDRTRLVPIRDLRNGIDAQIEGVITGVEARFHGRPMLKVAVSEVDGSTVVLRFFHFRRAQVQSFKKGQRLRAYGTPRPGQTGFEMVHPSYRVLGAQPEALGESLEPVYPAIEGVGAVAFKRLMQRALALLPEDAVLELLPDRWRAHLQLPPLREALQFLHAPPADADVAALQAGTHPAQQRLALEEMLAHHLSLRRQRQSQKSLSAPALPAQGQGVACLLQSLPFALTDAQARVFAEIQRDLAKPVPMQRLVQGDVGSGKTVVAALAAMRALDAGFQVALMAPTELLAEQHAQTLQGWFAPLGIELAWLAGKVTGKARQAVLADIASGKAQLIVGTHALMQEGVQFARLALVIIDEQHRFGVQQRLSLRDKGDTGDSVPHQLVMTATPIPRTLAMTAYADLDVSVIDQLPPGRTPVRTVAIAAERRPELIERIRAAIAEGRQAYWVCTLIDEQEEGARKIEAQAAQSTWQALCEALPEVSVGLVHGRMKAAEKQAVMAAFKAGELSLLVATTVIEVGVDVPNASLMIIENAERLGLAQLHQLRGRVGRGSTESSCVLLYQSPLGHVARQRLDTLRQTHDGFVIAEKDLALRGPGELLGTRQTGLAEFRIADLVRDAHWLPKMQPMADALLEKHPDIADRLVSRWVGGAVRYAAA